MKTFFFSLIIMTVSLALHAQQGSGDLFVGTYTNSGKSEGIYIYSFNDVTGDVSLKEVFNEIEDPSFLAFSSKTNVLYAVSEADHEVSAFSYKNGKLNALNALPSGSSGPCHIITDKNNEYVFVSNYGGGSLSVYNTNENGSLRQLVQDISFKGNGPNKKRQTKSHVHSATLSPDEQFLLVQDLGTDRITIYPFMPENINEPLTINKAIAIQTPPGSGPRHIAFSPDGNFVYVVAELTSAVQVYRFDGSDMALIQELKMLSSDVDDPAGAADIHLSEDGNFLYTSNRGKANEINVYKINKQDGKLVAVERESVQGNGPRNFAISKNGNFLLVGNQNSDEIVVFNRNAKSGKLDDTGKRISVGTPVCLIFN